MSPTWILYGWIHLFVFGVDNAIDLGKIFLLKISAVPFTFYPFHIATENLDETTKIRELIQKLVPFLYKI